MKRLIQIAFFFLATTASAQHLTPSARSIVAYPQALGMGDAVVAMPTGQSAFFYNPAHAAHAPFRVTFIGARASISNSFSNQLRFVTNELRPAVDEGFDALQNEALSDLYSRALEVGRKPAFLNMDLLAPSASFHIGAVGVGLGLFGQSTVRYNFPAGGGGMPYINLAAVADAMIVGNAGVDLSRFGVSGLSAGLTAKYTRRYVTLKNRPIDVLDSNEPFNLLVAGRPSVDAGFLYEMSFLSALPGKMQVGLALYDIIGSQFSFQLDRTISGTENAQITQQDISAANSLFSVNPSFRMGFAYQLPSLPGGLLTESGVTLDYIGYQNPTIDQSFFAHLRVGVQAKVKVFALRAGLNQGYPTVGAGINLGFMDLDYAFYGVEQGRYPGQLASWHHAAQLRFGL